MRTNIIKLRKKQIKQAVGLAISSLVLPVSFAYGDTISTDGQTYVNSDPTILTINADDVTLNNEDTVLDLEVNGNADNFVLNNEENKEVLADSNNTAIRFYDDLDGSINNDGLIESDKLNSGSSVAIDVDGRISGAIINGPETDGPNGGIRSILDSNSQNITSTAIEADELTGSITNDGVIYGEAESDNNNEAIATGIYLQDVGDTGSIANNEFVSDGQVIDGGRIIAIAGSLDGEEANYNRAYGIHVWDEYSGELVNDGLISGEASNSANGSQGYGVNIQDLTGNVTNSETGIILGIAGDAGDYSEAYGLTIDRITQAGSVSNSGFIYGLSANEDDSAYASGLKVFDTATGDIFNDGILFGLASSSDDAIGQRSYATAYGASLNTLQGTFTNEVNNEVNEGEDSISGLIMGEAYADGYDSGSYDGGFNESAYSYAYGAYIGEIDTTGQLLNDGAIMGEANSDAELTYSNTSTLTNLDDKSADTSYDTWAEATASGLRSADITGELENSNLIYGEASARADSYFSESLIATENTTSSDTSAATLDISADMEADSYAEAYGLKLTGDSVNSIYNEGGIIGTAESYADADSIISLTASANNAGFYTVEGEDYGYSNNALADARAIANADADSYAYGMFFADDTDAGTTITNAEDALIGGFSYAESDADVSIYVSATADGTATGNSYSDVDSTAYSNAYGLLFINDMAGTITNSGAIVGEAEAYADYSESITNLNNSYAYSSTYTYAEAYAFGVRVDNDLTGTINNESTGGIYAEAFASADEAQNGTSSYAYAYGILVDDELLGRINNAGTIEAHSEAYQESYAAGIFVDEEIDGYIYNSGLIEADARGRNRVEATAIYGESLSGGIEIAETGELSAYASSSDYSSAYGIHIENQLDYGSEILNNGLISATAETDVINSVDAYSAGILVGGEGFVPTEVRGQITNNGDIVSEASITVEGEDKGGSTYALSYGIMVDGDVTLGGSIVNNGEIVATAYNQFDDTYAQAYGVAINTLDQTGEFINTGTIRGLAGTDRDNYISDNGFSIGILYGDGTVYNSGNLFGSLSLGEDSGDELSLDNSGMAGIIHGGFGWVSEDYTQRTRGLIGLGVNSDTDYATFEVDGLADFTASNAIAMNVGADDSLTGEDILEDALSMNSGLTGATDFRMIDNNLSLNFDAVEDVEGQDDLWDIHVVDTGLTTINAAQVDVGNQSGLDAGRILQDGMDFTRDAFHALDTSWSPMHRALFELGSLSTEAQVSDAVERTLPALSGATNQVSLDVTRTMTDMLSNRMLSTGGMSSGNGYITNGNLWVKPFGGFADQDSNKGVSGYDGNFAGIASGLDWGVGENGRFGVGIAYARSSMDSDGAANQNAVSKNVFGSMYGSYMLTNALQLNAQVGYGKINNENNRKVNFAGINYTARSDYDGDVATAGLGLSHLIKASDNVSWVTSLRADYALIDNDSYTEKGQDALSLNALNLDVDGYKTEELIVSLKETFQYKFTDSAMAFASVGVGHDAINDKAKMSANYVGGSFVNIGDYRVDPMDRSSTIYTGALGVDMITMGGWTVTGRYDFTGRSDYTNHVGSLRVMLPF